MDGNGYKQILTEYLIPFAKAMYGNDALLHQDNASTHRAQKCTEILRICKLTNIKAPAYSPDLNPIEVKLFYNTD